MFSIGRVRPGSRMVGIVVICGLVALAPAVALAAEDAEEVKPRTEGGDGPTAEEAQTIRLLFGEEARRTTQTRQATDGPAMEIVQLRDGYGAAAAAEAMEAIVLELKALAEVEIKCLPQDGWVALYGKSNEIEMAKKLMEQKRLLPETPRVTAPEVTRRLGYNAGRSAEDVVACRDEITALAQAAKGPCELSIAPSADAVSITGPEAAVAMAIEELTRRGLAHDPAGTCCRAVQLYHVREPNELQALLASVATQICPEVKITGCESTGALPTVLLMGPRCQVEDMQRVIASIDRPRPQVRLDLWAFQVSGPDASRVADAAYWGRQYAGAARHLLRGYLGIVERIAITQQPYTDRTQKPVSTTQALTLLTMAASDGDDVEDRLQYELSRWYGDILRSANSGDDRDWASVVLLECGSGQYVEAGTGDERPVVDTLMPRDLTALLRDNVFRDGARQALRDLGTTMTAYKRDPRSLEPDQLRQDAESARGAMQRVQQALADDIERVFMEPLRECLNSTNLATGGRGSKRWAFSGATSISVLSGVEATLAGSAISTFDMSRPAQLDTATLTRAHEIAKALGTALPPRTGGAGGLFATKVLLGHESDTAEGKPVSEDELNKWSTHITTVVAGLQALVLPSEGALLLSGTEEAVKAGMVLLETGRGTKGAELMQVAETTAASVAPLSAMTGSVGGIPADRALSLALALGQEQELWTALRHGIELTVRPDVLPGGDTAELAITCKVHHEDEGSAGEGGRVAEPISRVAKHEATTHVYVDSLDLFGLSSLEMSTTHPRPDFEVPLLGQMPIIGSMFTYPRSPRKVHHESLLLIQTHVRVTGMDLAESLGHGERRSGERVVD